MIEKIPFNKPYISGKEIEYMKAAMENGHLSGDGPFTKKCQLWLEEQIGCKKALLTPSCTAALEMTAILAGIKPGDEVIMPSFTFVSTANAFVLRGGVPVFIDIRPDTMNMDENLIEAAITKKTRAIVPVHYAGVACEMDTIMTIAEKYNLLVIEDAAQAISSSYKGRPLGSIGHLAALSFHETKNIHCGEGGALLINDEQFIERAEIIREKGTDRSKFFRGQVDKYTWVDIGSSYLLSELNAAFLWAQLENAEVIINKRLSIWGQYNNALTPLQESGFVCIPFIPDNLKQNGHLYYIKLDHFNKRTEILLYLKTHQVLAVFHYVPLHSSIAGVKFGRFNGLDKYTSAISERLIRLPLFIDLDDSMLSKVTNLLYCFFERTV
jgi:dTDP-4-amino-4,6-dideoxygalactose transaminase